MKERGRMPELRLGRSFTVENGNENRSGRQRIFCLHFCAGLIIISDLS